MKLERFRAINHGAECKSALANGDEGNTVIGYAAVFEAEYKDDFFGLVETIKPGAFTRAIEEKHDVRSLIDHDPTLINGRTRSGTLLLKQDARGLYTETKLPETSYARDLRQKMSRGDVDGMSFGFKILEQKWGERNGMITRDIYDLELFDISVVTYPAYTATEADLRERRSLLDAAKQSMQVPKEIIEARLSELEKYIAAVARM